MFIEFVTDDATIELSALLGVFVCAEELLPRPECLKSPFMDLDFSRLCGLEFF